MIAGHGDHVPSPDADYAVADGWIGYRQGNRIFVRSGDGSLRQVESPYYRESSIVAVGSEEVIVWDDGCLFRLAPDRDPAALSPSSRFVRWLDHWYLASGATLFRFDYRDTASDCSVEPTTPPAPTPPTFGGLPTGGGGGCEPIEPVREVDFDDSYVSGCRAAGGAAPPPWSIVVAVLWIAGRRRAPGGRR